LFDVTGKKGWQLTDERLLTVDFEASSRRESAGFTNTVFRTSATYYRKLFDIQMLTASIDIVATHGLDYDQQVVLGGDSGLRGFPLRYQSGTSRALLRLEDRFFTDWYPFHLLRVGFAAFVDAGRTWGEDPRTTPSLGMLYDAGFGLRLSSPKASSGSVVHLDFAFPLNGDPSISGVQVSVKTKASF
jgi:hemolysin activation/secretion protein